MKPVKYMYIIGLRYRSFYRHIYVRIIMAVQGLCSVFKVFTYKNIIKNFTMPRSNDYSEWDSGGATLPGVSYQQAFSNSG